MPNIDKINLNGVIYDVADTKAVHYDTAQSLTDANKATARENIGAAREDMLDYIEDCARRNLIPYACNGSETNALTVVQVGNEVTLNGTSGAKVGQIGTKILITDHIHSWNASTTSAAENVYTIPLLDGHTYRLRGTIVSGTREAGSADGWISLILRGSNGRVGDEIRIEMTETTGEMTVETEETMVQIRVIVQWSATVTDLVIRIELEDVTQAVALDEKQDALTFDNAPTENSTNPVTSDGIYKSGEKVKSDLALGIENAIGVRLLSFVPGGIEIGGIGDTVDPTPNTSYGLAAYGCVYAEIAPGETVKYNMYNTSTSYRNFAFLDANNVLLQKARSRNYGGEREIVAPQGCAYVVLNTSNLAAGDVWSLIVPASIDEKPWAGLYVSLLGDSGSALKNYIPTGNDPYYGKTGKTDPSQDSPSYSGITRPEEMWWGQVIYGLGGTPLIIDAWSGSCVCKGISQEEIDPEDPEGQGSKIAMVDVSRCNNLHAYVQAEQGEEGALLVVSENPGEGEVALSEMRTSPFLPAYTPSVGDYVRRIDPDIVIVEGGGNDYSYIKNMDQLGTFDGHQTIPNPYSNEPTGWERTFREAYATLLTRLHAKYPLALPICCTGIFACRPYVQNYKINQRSIFLNAEEQAKGDQGEKTAITIQDFMNAIREIAFLYACPTVDIYTNGFTRYNYYGADGEGFASDRATATTHPNKRGMTVMARNAIPKFRDACAGFVQWMRESKQE